MAIPGLLIIECFASNDSTVTHHQVFHTWENSRLLIIEWENHARLQGYLSSNEYKFFHSWTYHDYSPINGLILKMDKILIWKMDNSSNTGTPSEYFTSEIIFNILRNLQKNFSLKIVMTW